MILLDSSVVIAAFRQNEKMHNEAIDIIKKSWKIIILDYILSEILTVLKMRESHGIAVKCLDFLNNNNNIDILKVSDLEFDRSLNFFETNNNKLSFVDILLLEVKKYRNIKLATFDKDLTKASIKMSS